MFLPLRLLAASIFIVASLTTYSAEPLRMKVIISCPDNAACGRIDQEIRKHIKSRADLSEVKDGTEVMILRIEIAPARAKDNQDAPIGFSVALLIQRSIDGKQWILSRFGSAFIPYDTMQASTREMLTGALK